MSSSITVTKYLRKSTWRRKFLFWFMGHKSKVSIYGLLVWLLEVRQNIMVPWKEKMGSRGVGRGTVLLSSPRSYTFKISTNSRRLSNCELSNRWNHAVNQALSTWPWVRHFRFKPLLSQDWDMQERELIRGRQRLASIPRLKKMVC